MTAFREPIKKQVVAAVDDQMIYYVMKGSVIVTGKIQSGIYVIV